jgi:hypothetical protein
MPQHLTPTYHNIEAETWHDQRPSHRPRPDWLIEAESAAASAWRDHDAAIERYLAGTGDHAEMMAAGAAGRIAQEWADDLRSAWMRGETPASLQDCTCDSRFAAGEGGQACRYCREQNDKRYGKDGAEAEAEDDYPYGASWKDLDLV